MRKRAKRSATREKTNELDIQPPAKVGSIITLGNYSMSLPAFVSVLLNLLLFASAAAQAGGNFTLYGDVKVDESKVTGIKPISFDVILQSQRLSTMGRQSVPKNGRYRFENLSAGIYYVLVMLEGTEVTNVRVMLNGTIGYDARQDINLAWQPDGAAGKGGVISASGHYARSARNQAVFERAQEAERKKEYGDAKTLLQGIVSSDPKDFEAWTELGTVDFLLKDNLEAERAYAKALTEEPSFILALINVGKLRLSEKKYEGAIEVLSKAASIKPPSAEANYFLGEAYLGTKKGSKAVDYMNEALRIDPIGKAEIHLRIGAIYDNVGLKNLAAAEYEQFLKKRPDYPDKKKLEKYIAENKRP